jgi:hypothetical protein
MLGRTISLAGVASMLVPSGVRAETIQPIEGKSIDLGTLTGIVYYAAEPEGYRVVATLGTDTPIRFTATLAREQSVILSTPRGLGEPAIEVRIMRRGDQLLVGGGSRLLGE